MLIQSLSCRVNAFVFANMRHNFSFEVTLTLSNVDFFSVMKQLQNYQREKLRGPMRNRRKRSQSIRFDTMICLKFYHLPNF